MDFSDADVKGIDPLDLVGVFEAEVDEEGNLKGLDTSILSNINKMFIL